MLGQSSQQPWMRTAPSATTRRATNSLWSIQIGRLVPSCTESASGRKTEFDMTCARWERATFCTPVLRRSHSCCSRSAQGASLRD